MQYAILIYTDNERPDLGQGDAGACRGEFPVLSDPVVRSQVRLQGKESATTVRMLQGRPLIVDGPFAETKEIFGGLLVIDVPDLDAALAFASRAATEGAATIEVRPLK